MPRAPKAREVSEVQETKMTKKEAKNVLPYLLQDDDLAELALASDPRLASLYLIAEKAAKRSIMEILTLLGNREERKEDELDKALKALMLKKLEKELESTEEMKKLLLPLVIQSYQESQRQRMLYECIQQKMSQAVLNQPFDFDYLKALQECQMLAQSSSTLLSSLLPLLSSQSPLSQASQVPPQVQPAQSQEVEVSQDELETI